MDTLVRLYDILNSDILTFQNLDFEEFCNYTRKLDSNKQLLFIKKVFQSIEKKTLNIGISELQKVKTYSLDAFIEFGEPKNIDYSVDLIIHSLNWIANNNSFPKDINEIGLYIKEIADFVFTYIKEDPKYLKSLDILLDKCVDRTAIYPKTPDEWYIKINDNAYKLYEFYTGYSIIDRDKKTKYGTLLKHFRKGIFFNGKKCYLEVISTSNYDDKESVKYGDTIEIDNEKKHFKWKKDNLKYLITTEKGPTLYCEGKKSEKLCEHTNSEFWWCYNRKCLKANHVYSDFNNWRDYTFKDFVKILSLPFDKKGYIELIGELNRFNRLLSRLKCKNCGNLLRPSKQSYYGFYRVTHFNCNNNKCSDYLTDIYLTHCLNSRCTNIIDSRVAKRCSNGFVICDKCSSCCSNDLFNRRIENLKVNSNSIPNELINLLKNKAGHWDKLECFCFKCLTKLEFKGGSYICDNCKIEYDRNLVYLKFNPNFKTKVLQKAC